MQHCSNSKVARNYVCIYMYRGVYIYKKVSEIFQINNTIEKKIGPIYCIRFFFFFVHKMYFSMGDRIFAS